MTTTCLSPSELLYPLGQSSWGPKMPAAHCVGEGCSDHFRERSWLLSTTTDISWETAASTKKSFDGLGFAKCSQFFATFELGMF
eukprot:3824094-Amphidinium_carterae.1